VFMAVKTEGADAKMKDANAEEEAKREGSRAAVAATKSWIGSTRSARS